MQAIFGNDSGGKDPKIEYPERQKAIDLTVSAKSIRMDVYVEDGEHTVYDVEMQNGRNRNLPKRSRYYSGLIDLNILAKGEDYNQLKKSLVIFICTFDPFGHDEYIYRCGEYYQLSDGSYHPLGDDAWKIFVNAKGHKGDVSDGFRSLMRYIMDGEAQDPYTQALEKKVALVNNDEEWKVGYMTWAIKLADERREAREEGRKEGNISTLYGLYSDSDITLEKAAVKAGMSEQAFLEVAKKIVGI